MTLNSLFRFKTSPIMIRTCSRITRGKDREGLKEKEDLTKEIREISN